MPKLPAVNYKQIARVAKRMGFYCARKAKGSHEIWRCDGSGKQTTIPNHGNRPLKRKTFTSILNDIGITVEDFMKIK